MLTCKSPRKVMWLAYHAARQALPDHTSRFSRKDFTLPQLFACLVVREQQRHSYRGIEALLLDSDHWCKAIGMRKVPDHNTLCRAFHAIVNGHNAGKLLDLLTRWMGLAKQLGHTLAIDSSLYDTHHRSRHYEQRCRHYSTGHKPTADLRRSRSARRTPKLGIGVDTRSHLIVSTCPRTGMGSDCRDFVPLLYGAIRRRRFKSVLADAGYDSDANHQAARSRGVRSLIKAQAGRPSLKPPTSRYPRLMRQELDGSQKGRLYGQRAQVETVNSMLKRNLGDSLRARSDHARRCEQLLRAITHNVMIVRS